MQSFVGHQPRSGDRTSWKPTIQSAFYGLAWFRWATLHTRCFGSIRVGNIEVFVATETGSVVVVEWAVVALYGLFVVDGEEHNNSNAEQYIEEAAETVSYSSLVSGPIPTNGRSVLVKRIVTFRLHLNSAIIFISSLPEITQRSSN